MGRKPTTWENPAAVQRRVSASGDICAWPIATTWMRALRLSPVTSAMSAAGRFSSPSTYHRSQSISQYHQDNNVDARATLVANDQRHVRHRQAHSPSTCTLPYPIEVGTLEQRSLLQHCARPRLVMPMSSIKSATTHKRPALVTGNGRRVCRRQAQQPHTYTTCRTPAPVSCRSAW